MRMILTAMLLALLLAASGCVGGNAAASNDGARANLLLGKSF